jgi:hypothetical protein
VVSNVSPQTAQRNVISRGVPLIPLNSASQPPAL